MSKGFEVERAQPLEPSPLKTLRAQVYHALDTILHRMCEGESRGGAALIEGDVEGESLKFKITFADVTDQKECPRCNGTGVDGS